MNGDGVDIHRWAQPTAKDSQDRYIKFTLLLDDKGKPGKLLFQNTVEFPFHLDFLKTRPEFKNFSAADLDKVTLTSDHRKAILGTLVIGHYAQSPQGKIYRNASFELWSHDSLPVDVIAEAHKQIQSQLAEEKFALRYAPISELRKDTLSKTTALKKAGIEVELAHLPSQSQTYHEGWAVGRVRALTAKQVATEMKKGTILPTDILVVDSVPREVPPIAGMITNTPTSAQSHVALLAPMYDFPLAYVPKGDELKKWQANGGELVFFKADEYGVEPPTNVSGFTPAETSQLLGLKHVAPLSVIDVDKNYQTIGPISETSTTLARSGSKAANLATLLSPLPKTSIVPSGQIPFFYYEKYLDTTKLPDGTSLREYLQSKLASIEDPATALSKITKTLAEIQSTFAQNPPPDTLVKEVQNELQRMYGKSAQVLLRSSSNVEDGNRFNGAGLYESTSVNLAKKSSIAEGLSSVFNSLMSTRGYLARRMFGVDEKKVSMAFLTNPDLKNETANGVVVVRKRDGKFEVTINSFPGQDTLVTHAPAGEMPEAQVLTGEKSGKAKDLQREKIAPTTLLPIGRSVMSDGAYAELYALTTKAWEHWQKQHPDEKDLALDLEWMGLKDETGHEHAVLRQVRQVPVPAAVPKDEEQSFILADRDLKLSSIYHEDPRGLLQLLTNIGIDLKLGLYSSKGETAGKLPIESLVLHVAGNDYPLLGTALSAKGKATKWTESGAWGGGGPLLERSTEWRLPLPNPLYPSLALGVKLNEEKLEASKTTTHFTHPADLEFKLKVKAADLPALGEKRGTLEVELAAQGSQASHDKVSQTKPFKKEFVGPGFSLLLEGLTEDPEKNPVLKTRTETINRVTVKGLFSKPRVIQNPRSAVYAPAHHNFNWQYAIDLATAKGITTTELAKLAGRYLVIKSEGQSAELVDEKGKSTLLGAVEITGDPHQNHSEPSYPSTGSMACGLAQLR